jgi:hypothetical protein
MAALPHLAIAPLRGKIYASICLRQQPFIAPSLPSNAPVLPKRIAKCLYFVEAAKVRFVIDFLLMRKRGCASLPDIWPAQV